MLLRVGGGFFFVCYKCRVWIVTGEGGRGGFLYATSVCGRNVSNFGNKKSQNTHFIIKRFSFKSTNLFNE